tara:strand:- start:110 stop:1144 length:1035 start_codon:yes stop_codon:yes gene_type:complete
MERVMSDLSDWLFLVDEEIIEPERPIIDPHHHLWRDHRSLNRSIDYDLNDLWADTESGHNIIATVFVECGADYRSSGPESLRPVGETDYVKSAADLSILGASKGRPPIKGIVSHVDLRLGAAVEEVISAQIDAGEGLLKGIRHATAYYPDPPAVDRYAGRIEHLMMSKEFREGFALLAPAGLSYDAWLLHPQIRELTDLAEAFPETIIIFDHFGGPLGIGPYQGKQRDIFPQWQRDVQQLSRCANVVAKLGGLAMPINGWGWDEREMPASSDEIVAAHQDYYLHTIDCFGPERCMFESNFPVDKLSVSYAVLWNALKKIGSRFNETEKDLMFRGTAQRIYRLEI